jgi:hypothetical protein
MINANPVTNDTRNPQTTVPAATARAAAGPPKLAAVRLYSRPDADRPATAADWQIREEPEYYIPDLLSDRDYAPDPALIEAAEAHTEEQREAMALLDDAENLLAVLLASQEQECDSRAMQAEAVLKLVRKQLNKAHNRIDRQESSHRNLFLAYFELNPNRRPGVIAREPVMIGDREENGIEADDPGESRADDPDVEIHEAILARDRAGGSFPDASALAAMEEPLHRLTSAAVLFSDVTTESTEGAELRMRGLSFLAEAICREAFRLFRLYHGHPPRPC